MNDAVGDRWYESRAQGDSLQQGDQIWDFLRIEPVVLPDGKIAAQPFEMDIVVLTQSCDLEHGKVDPVLVAEMVPVSEWVEENPKDLPRLEDIRQGIDVSLYLLPAWTRAPHRRGQEDRVVDFSRLLTVPRKALDATLEAGLERLGMQSPAREHLAQAVARTFMRVGLPQDIPSYRLKDSGREEAIIAPSELTAAALGEFGTALVRGLPVVGSKRVRPSTGEQFYWLSVDKRQPQVFGAGRDKEQAQQSLLRQLGRRWAELQAGHDRYQWLNDYMESARPAGTALE